MVERSNPGLKLDRLEHKLGIKASDTANFVLEDCRVPKENLLGSPEIDTKKSFAGAMQTFDNTRPLVAGMAVGVARACLERTQELLAEAGRRGRLRPPGRTRQRAAAAELLELEADYEAARLLTLEAAWMADNSKPNSLHASYAKAKAGRACVDIALRCVALCGTRRLRRGRAAREVGPRRQDPRHLRGHPADPASDHRPPAARQDLGRAQVAAAFRQPHPRVKETDLNAKTRPVAVLGGNRIPFARSNGAYAKASNQDMLTAALDGLVDRSGLEGERLGEVAGGAVLKHSRDFNLTRECVLGSKLAPETPAYDVGQACGTGLRGGDPGRQQDRARPGRTRRSPAASTRPPTRRSRSTTTSARSCSRPTTRRSNADRLRGAGEDPPGPRSCPRSRATPSRAPASRWASTRRSWPRSGGSPASEQDELAAASHQNLAAAYDRGFCDDLVTPYLGLERDQNLRADSTVEKLAKLKPVFGGEDGTMTAGNSTPLSDGASAVLLAQRGVGRARTASTPLAYFVDAETAAVDYVGKKEGLLMAPAYAVPRMLARNGLTLQDFDLYEIHEAFAAQVLCTLKAWEDPVFCKQRLGLDEPLGSIDRAKLNVNGGSLAAGAPVRRDRRADRRRPREDARRARRRPRPDLDLRRRRPGRRRDPRAPK